VNHVSGMRRRITKCEDTHEVYGPDLGASNACEPDDTGDPQ
jgi:hypothetical protein